MPLHLAQASGAHSEPSRPLLASYGPSGPNPFRTFRTRSAARPPSEGLWSLFPSTPARLHPLALHSLERLTSSKPCCVDRTGKSLVTRTAMDQHAHHTRVPVALEAPLGVMLLLECEKITDL